MFSQSRDDNVIDGYNIKQLRNINDYFKTKL